MKQSFLKLKIILLLFSFGCSSLFSKDLATFDPFVLITMLYNETSPQRIAEYTTCLQKNKDHGLIDTIHVLYDVSKDNVEGYSNEIRALLDQENVFVTPIIGRPTYEDIFVFANKEYPNRRIILSNADIYFNDTLYKLETYTAWENTLFALTRWNVQDDYTTLRLEGFAPGEPNLLSADTWIFKTPFTPFAGTEAIWLGSLDCDNALTYAAVTSGVAVKNPCVSLQCCHLHISQIRHYLDDQAVTRFPMKGGVPWRCLEGWESDNVLFQQELARLKPYTDTSVEKVQEPHVFKNTASLEQNEVGNNGYIFVTMLYNEKNPQRIEEYKTCLRKNKEHPSIGRIHVFYDTTKDSLDPKDNLMYRFIEELGCVIWPIKNGLSYGDVFEIVNEQYPNKRVILALADIFFNQTLEKLNAFKEWENNFLALTRWNIQDDGTVFLEGLPGGKPNYSSHDAWIFQTPMKVSSEMKSMQLGAFGSDCGIAHAVSTEGYTLLNPCASLQALHLHFSKRPHYTEEKSYRGPHVSIPWSWLPEFPKDKRRLSLELKRIELYDKLQGKKSSDGFILLTMLYNESDANRIEEYKTCILKNKAHSHIKEIHVLYDMSKDSSIQEENELLQFLRDEKIKITVVNSRKSYQHFFDVANQLYPDQKIILSNADIYFDETLNLFDQVTEWDNQFFALTRWNIHPNGLLTLQGWIRDEPYSCGSQDTWIFKTPINKVLGAENILMGTIGCDAGIARATYDSGYRVSNPCFAIHCYHLHMSGIRNYTRQDTYRGGLMDVPFTSFLP